MKLGTKIGSSLALRNLPRKAARCATQRAAWNRPELPEHSQSIAKYILENYEKAYIIPPPLTEHPATACTSIFPTTRRISFRGIW